MRDLTVALINNVEASDRIVRETRELALELRARTLNVDEPGWLTPARKRKRPRYQGQLWSRDTHTGAPIALENTSIEYRENVSRFASR